MEDSIVAGVKELGPFGRIKQISWTKAKVVLGSLAASQKLKWGEKEKNAFILISIYSTWTRVIDSTYFEV